MFLANLMDALTIEGKIRTTRKQVEERAHPVFDAPTLREEMWPDEAARIIAQHHRSPFTTNDEVNVWSNNLDTVYQSGKLGQVSLLGVSYTHRVPGPWQGTVTDGFTALYAIVGTKVTTLARAELVDYKAIEWPDAHQHDGSVHGPVVQQPFVSLFQRGGIITVEMGLQRFDRRTSHENPIEVRTLLMLSFNQDTLERAAPTIVVTA